MRGRQPLRLKPRGRRTNYSKEGLRLWREAPNPFPKGNDQEPSPLSVKGDCYSNLEFANSNKNILLYSIFEQQKTGPFSRRDAYEPTTF